LVGAIGDGEDVRRDLVPSPVDVHLDHGLGVDREPLVRVHGNAEQARVGLEKDFVKGRF